MTAFSIETPAERPGDTHPTEILIEHATVAGYVLVVVPRCGWIESDYVSAHQSHVEALDEALRLQKGTFAPATIRDFVAGAP